MATKIRCYFAAAKPYDVDLLADEGVDAILLSFAHFSRGFPDSIKRFAKPKSRYVMVDSGGLSNAAPGGSRKAGLEAYMDFLKSNKALVDEYVTLDDLFHRETTLRNYYRMREEGLDPLFVDHQFYRVNQRVAKIYQEGKKLCWAGMLQKGQKGTLPNQWKRLAFGDLVSILDKRSAPHARKAPLSRVHALGVGMRLRQFMPWFDVIHSFDSASACIAAAKYAKVGFLTKDKLGRPRVKLVNYRSMPDFLKRYCHEHKLDVTTEEDRIRTIVRALRSLYSGTIAYYDAHKSGGGDVYEVAKAEGEWAFIDTDDAPNSEAYKNMAKLWALGHWGRWEEDEEHPAAKQEDNEEEAWAEAALPERLEELDDGALVDLLDMLDDHYHEMAEGHQEEVVNRALFVMAELERRGKDLPEMDVVQAALALRGKDVEKAHAPIATSGVEEGPAVRVEDVLDAMGGDAVIRRGAVTLVGGVCNHGETKGDLDVLVRGPLDEATKRVIQFRVGRMLAAKDPTLADRIHWLEDDMGGPFTNHVELFDLVLVPRRSPKVIEMRADVEKANPVELLATPGAGPHPAVYQLHYRGRSVHGDLRIKLNGKLIGWTLMVQKAGSVPEVTKVDQARRLAEGLGLSGNRIHKPLDTARVQATPKLPQPLEWLKVDNRVFDEGEVGATAEGGGVMIAVDHPEVEWGVQEPYYHEYFLSGAEWFNGILRFRQLQGGGRPASEGGMPEGELFWVARMGVDLVPSILQPRAVQTGKMPPDGISWIPLSLMKAMPKEYRYWEAKGTKAREMRDALVKAKVVTPDTVKMVGGEFRLVTQKMFLVLEADVRAPVEEPVRKAEAVKFLILRQSFRAENAPRMNHTEVIWWMAWEDGGGLQAFKLQGDPTEGAKVTAQPVHFSDKDFLEMWGQVDPKDANIGGVDLNPTKATSSDLYPVDSGKLVVMEEKPGLYHLSVKGDKVKGEVTFEREDKGGASLWTFQRGGVQKLKVEEWVPDQLREASNEELLLANLRLHQLWGAHFEGNEAEQVGDLRRDVLRAASEAIVAEMRRRGMTPDKLLEKAPVAKAMEVQRWDPEMKDPDRDRTSMRPPALFRPQKPSGSNAFYDRDDLVAKFVTEEGLKAGYLVEPKWNGRVVVVERAEDGTVTLFFEDKRVDRADQFPALSKAAKEMPKSIIMVGELLDRDEDGNLLPRRDLARFGTDQVQDDSRALVNVWDVLYLDGDNLTDKPLVERKKAVERALGQRGKGPFVPTPFKLVHTANTLKEATGWASKQAGSEGAMVKLATGTYTLGGETDSDAKLKLVRTINAVVYAKTKKAPGPAQRSPADTWIYQCAIGPIAASEKDKWAKTEEVKGSLYVPIGKTFATNVDAKEGDVLRVEVTEMLLIDRAEGAEVSWFTPMVQERVAVRPTTVSQMRAMLHRQEVRKSSQVAILKRDEDLRYVLGVVLEPNDGESGAPLEPDSHSDVYSVEEIRETAHQYLMSFTGLGEMHRREATPDEMRVCESYLAPADMEIEGQRIRKGSWMLGARIFSDSLWQKVKEGTYNAFSIDGEAVREPKAA